MDTQEITSKLQRAYHSMVDTLGNLIEKEGKSLSEAIELSQQKLSEWEELSKEEVKKVSDEVKRDLSSVVETLNEVRQSIRKKLITNTDYLTEASLDRLSQIANKTTLELTEFNNELRKRAQESDGKKYQNENEQHQQWENEHAKWLFDIAKWQKEHQYAEEKLLGIEKAIRQHAINLQEHAQTIRAHQHFDHHHEVTMNEVIKDQSNDNAAERKEASEQTHQRMQQLHEKQAKIHQDIEQHHKEVVLLVDKLFNSLRKIKHDDG